MIENWDKIVLVCFKAYAPWNENYNPDVVVAIRDSCTDGQKITIDNNQIDNVLKTMAIVSQPSNLIYISIDPKPLAGLFKL